jgi:hypothetical protein
MEERGLFEAFIHFYWNTCQHTPEDSSFQINTFIMYHSMIFSNMSLLDHKSLAQALRLSSACRLGERIAGECCKVLVFVELLNSTE